MLSIELLDTGRIDERESAFAQAVQLPDGDILCSFSVGGGPNVSGGTDWARSSDGGKTWRVEGTILPFDAITHTANFLKLSLSADGQTIYAYGSTISADIDKRFGQRTTVPIFCTSTDGGHSWSPPRRVPFPTDCPLEVSHGILPLQSGRLLAPGGTLPAAERLGEQVLVAISDDGGMTWRKHGQSFRDPAGKLGFFEHKFAAVAPNSVLATAWTVTLGDSLDRPDSFAISRDGGETWSPSHSTGINGQTMTPISLGGDRLLVLYNRRYGEQGVMMCLVTFTDTSWTVHHEGMMYDAKSQRQRPENVTGIDELDTFAFGFPTAIRLHDGTFLATHWCVERGVCGIRWTKLRVNW